MHSFELSQMHTCRPDCGTAGEEDDRLVPPDVLESPKVINRQKFAKS